MGRQQRLVGMWIAAAFWVVTAASAPAGGGALSPLIAQLGDPQYARREAAQEELLREGHLQPEATLTACVTAYADQPDPEIRHRLRQVMAELVGQHLFRRPRGFLGIAYQRVMVAQEGGAVARFQVQRVTPDTAAAAAGLQAGDLILGLDKLEVSADLTTEEFSQYIQGRKPGVKLAVRFLRGGETKTVDVVLGAMPAEVETQFYSAERERAYFEAWLAKRLELVQRR